MDYDGFESGLDDSNKEDLNFGSNDNFSFGGGYGETTMDKHSDLLKGLTDFDPFLKNLVSEWLGLVWDDDTKKFVEESNVRPVLNIQGARWCINFIRTYARNNNIITTVGRDEYNDIISDIIDVVYLNVGTRAEEFGIKNNGDILLVCNQVIHTSMLVLMGAGGSNNYNALLSTTVNRNESVSMNRNNDMFSKPNSGGGNFASRVWNKFTGG